jgi:hypothetical protein
MLFGEVDVRFLVRERLVNSRGAKQEKKGSKLTAANNSST